MKVTSKSNQLVFSGRIGPTVNYLWCGRWCVRSLPSQYNDARTEAQLSQRSLFKQTVAFAAKARRVLKLGLRAVSKNEQMTESNYLMRLNKQCFALEDGLLAVDYERLRLSDGPVAPVAFGVPQTVDETTISVDFEKNPLHRSTKSDDLVYLVAYCPELGDFDISDPVARRRNGLTMSLNEAWVGREVHLWGFVVDCAGRASQCQYIGSWTLGDTADNADESTLATLDDGIQPTSDITDTQAVATNKPHSSTTSHRIDGSAPLASPPE